MTLYVTLNDDGTLALDSDHGGSRSEVATDSPDGPTDWAFKPSWGVPERAESLVRSAIDDAVANNDIPLAISIVTDAAVEDFVDDR